LFGIHPNCANKYFFEMSAIEDFATVKVSADQLIKGDDDFVDEFVCKICLVHVVGCGPQLTKCSHLFCGDCLQQWFDTHPTNQTWAQRAKAGGAVPCPVCKTSLQKDKDVYPVEQHGNANSAFLWRMIQGLKVKCDGKHSACGGSCCAWQGELGSYHNHLLSGTCGEVEIESDATGDEKLAKDSMTDCQSTACSDLSSELALEELPSDTAVDSSSPEESEREQSDSPPLHSLEPIDHDATASIQDLVTLGGSQHGMVQQPIEEFVPAVSPAKQCPKSPKKGKKANKKNQAGKKDSLAHDSQVVGKHITPEQVQAYQWQVAQYQTARYQQYLVAMQTQRMQQYYQYAQMASRSM
jgi:hypothetical protein